MVRHGALSKSLTLSICSARKMRACAAPRSRCLEASNPTLRKDGELFQEIVRFISEAHLKLRRLPGVQQAPPAGPQKDPRTRSLPLLKIEKQELGERRRRSAHRGHAPEMRVDFSGGSLRLFVSFETAWKAVAVPARDVLLVTGPRTRAGLRKNAKWPRNSRRQGPTSCSIRCSCIAMGDLASLAGDGLMFGTVRRASPSCREAHHPSSGRKPNVCSNRLV